MREAFRCQPVQTREQVKYPWRLVWCHVIDLPLRPLLARGGVIGLLERGLFEFPFEFSLIHRLSFPFVSIERVFCVFVLVWAVRVGLGRHRGGVDAIDALLQRELRRQLFGRFRAHYCELTGFWDPAVLDGEHQLGLLSLLVRMVTISGGSVHFIEALHVRSELEVVVDGDIGFVADDEILCVLTDLEWKLRGHVC